jgi:hypothetical protein
LRRYREATSKHAGLPTRRLLALHAQGECLGLAPEPPALGRNVPVVAVVSLALDVHAPPLLVRALPQPLVHLLVLEAGRSLLGLLQRLKPLARRVDPVGLPQPRRRLELLRDLACKMARARALCTWVRMLRVPHVLCIHNYAPAVSRSAKSGSAKILSSGRSSASGRRGPFPMPWPRMAACTLTPSAGPAIARATMGGDNCHCRGDHKTNSASFKRFSWVCHECARGMLGALGSLFLGGALRTGARSVNEPSWYYRLARRVYATVRSRCCRDCLVDSLGRRCLPFVTGFEGSIGQTDQTWY